MTYPAALLCHDANLQTSATVGTANDWGPSNEVPVYTAIKCRFGNPRETYNDVRSGDRLIKTPVCIVSTEIVPVVGKKLVGLTAPFNKTYLIKAVNPAPLAQTISHYVLEIEAVE